MQLHVSRPLNLRTTGSLITTRQAINSTKQGTTRSVYPGYSRPNVNGVDSSNSNNQYIAPFGRPRPLKLWRKQLQPNSVNRTKVTIGLIDAPGGIVFRGTNCNSGPGTSHLYVSEDIFEPNIKESLADSKIQNNGFVQIGDPALPTSYRINTGIYETKIMSSCPATRIIKSARTKLSRAYYSSTAAYLQSRCKTYQQKQSFSKIPGHTYSNANGALLPNNDPNGPQVFYATNCSNSDKIYTTNQNTTCRETTIHKPNNAKYGVQGAVSASSRLARLKLDTITKNGNSFRSAYGEAAANAGSYHGDTGSPYFLKTKHFKPSCNIYQRALRRPHLVC